MSERIHVETVLCEAMDPAAEILQAAHDGGAALLVIVCGDIKDWPDSCLDRQQSS